MDYLETIRSLLTDPKHTRWQTPLLLVCDAALTALIIWKIPYTEIDWKAYMEQVSQYVAGARDYTLIKGGTGPLVYPAMHVYVYKMLYDATDQGQDIRRAQIIFGALYLLTLALVFACYRQARVPPYVFPMLVLSKRLHSIFVLRCFNDCFAVAALWLAVYSYQRKMWVLGSVAYSWGIGVKMSLLLALPAIGVILLQAVGAVKALGYANTMMQLQIVSALPFLKENAFGYLSRAFEFSRQFLYKWTVNWRFIDEEIFISKGFSLSLLVLHATALLAFASTRWLKPSGKSVGGIIRMIFQPEPPQKQQEILRMITPNYVMTTILTANAIGMLFARSLHYQFYSWIAWATPFLLWRAGLPPVLQYAVWAAQEWAWNVYPSTNASSAVVVSALAVQVMAIWIGTAPFSPRNARSKAGIKAR